MLLSSVFLETLALEWTPTIEGCIDGFASGTVVENVADMVTCQFLCENSDIICLSVNYEHVEKKCRFNRADTSTVAVTPCSNYKFSEPVKCKLLFQTNSFSRKLQRCRVSSGIFYLLRNIEEFSTLNLNNILDYFSHGSEKNITT